METSIIKKHSNAVDNKCEGLHVFFTLNPSVSNLLCLTILRHIIVFYHLNLCVFVIIFYFEQHLNSLLKCIETSQNLGQFSNLFIYLFDFL